MTMLGAGLVILAVAFSVVGLLWVLPAYRRVSGPRVLTCPETREPTSVTIDARHAAATAWGGEVHLRLKDCARWPARADCGQECLGQIRA